MGLFTKKEDKLPELPKLPEFPSMHHAEEPKKSLQLPRFPSSPLGNKFSQNTIKEAITGRKEESEAGADEFAEEDKMQMMPKPQIKFSREMYEERAPSLKKVKEEPIFIRIDKFEEALNNFDKVKKQVAEIEKTLREVKEIKEEEEKELESWEKEMQSLKKQIEKIDDDIFSKIE